MGPRIETHYRGRHILCEVTGDDKLELHLQGVLRKRRPIAKHGTTYVWTNVELEWEMHHLIEGIYHADSGSLDLLIQGEPYAREHPTQCSG